MSTLAPSTTLAPAAAGRREPITDWRPRGPGILAYDRRPGRPPQPVRVDLRRARRLLRVEPLVRFGGRNWTIVSALMLLVPAVPMALVIEPGTRSASR